MIQRKGFTLIEMLVVIAIIGILATIVLVGLGPVQRSARDARRVADMKSVQNAIELYNTRCGFYPGGAPAGGVCPIAATASYAALKTALIPGIVSQVPNDPLNSGIHIYQYEQKNGGTSYVLGAILEDLTNPAFASSFGGANNTIGGTTCQSSVVAASGLYCVSI